jgi:hypothetical protein
VSLAEIEESIRQLTVRERRRISAFLVALEDESDQDQQRWMADKLSPADDGRWIPAEDALRELGQLAGC